jgi:hypothetical protein
VLRAAPAGRSLFGAVAAFAVACAIGAAGPAAAPLDLAAAAAPWELVQSATIASGTSVAVSGDGRTAVVGSPTSNSDVGSVTVYTRSGAAWSPVTTLRPPAKDKRAFFGRSVAVSANGTTVLVGAPFTNDFKGSAWVYKSAGGGVWVGTRLRVSGEGKSNIGHAVGLSANGRRAVVGGPDDANKKGAVWTFNLSGTRWSQGSKLTGKDESGKGRFGAAVSMAYEGDAFVVGAPDDANEQGAVWVYTRSGSKWKPPAKKLTQSYAKASFGSSVAIAADGATVVVGAPDVGATRGERGSGAAFALRRSGSQWKSAQLSASFPPSLEPSKTWSRGLVVAVSPDGLSAIVTALEGRNKVVVGGGAWVFARSATGFWFPQEKPFTGSSFFATGGASMSYAGEVAAIGGKVFSPVPAALSIAPSAGPTAGGTTVTITGSNFTKVRSVSFGTTPATSFTVDSLTSIRAVSPAAPAGTVHVTVTNAFGTSPQLTPGFFGGPSTRFFYVAAPTVTAVSPASGPPGGGTQVTITGTDLAGATAVRFGVDQASSFTVRSATEISAVTPPGSGTVDVTVTTPYGTSATGGAARFTYTSPETVIGFDNLATGGPGGSLVAVTNQYAGQGVTFNSLSAIDYAKGPSAIPGFAHSGTVAVEPCVGVEFCTTPARATFSPAVSLARVWVGFSFRLDAPLTVQLRAFNAGGSVVGTASATLPTRATPTPIATRLEVTVPSAVITRVEVAVPGGFNNALAIDDVAFRP